MYVVCRTKLCSWGSSLFCRMPWKVSFAIRCHPFSSPGSDKPRSLPWSLVRRDLLQ